MYVSGLGVARAQSTTLGTLALPGELVEDHLVDLVDSDRLLTQRGLMPSHGQEQMEDAYLLALRRVMENPRAVRTPAHVRQRGEFDRVDDRLVECCRLVAAGTGHRAESPQRGLHVDQAILLAAMWY